MIDYTLPLEKLPDPLPIEPLRKPFDVTITPPGSKSITNRAYVLAALAKGESRIIRPLQAGDTDLLLKALCTLGAEARWEGDDVLITGVNGRFPRGGHVNLGDGGTPTRFMIACACLAAEPVVVDGSPRMRERPIAEGVDMLRQLGAKIEYVEAEGRLPVRVVPSEMLRGSRIPIGRTQSSQSISALLLIAPWLPIGIELTSDEYPTSYFYVLLTNSMLNTWGAEFDENLKRFHVTTAPRNLNGRIQSVETDASSAVYWWAAAAMTPRSTVRIGGLPRRTVQPDICALRQVIRLGVDELYSHEEADIAVRWRRIMPAFSRGASLFPDGAMMTAVLAATADGACRLGGLRTLRVKETDRIAALATELRKVGCEVETTDESISIDPRGPESRVANPVIIETYNDHRMAMAFAVLGLARPGISIRNPACVRKSYPTFWQDFAKLYQ